MNLRRNPLLWLALFTVLANVGLTMPATRYGSGFVLLWILPGLAWAGLLSGRQCRPTVEEVAIGLGLGIGTVVLLTLLIHYLPGPLTLPMLLIAVNLLILTLILLTPRRPISKLEAGAWDSKSAIVRLLFVICVTAFFRLTNLGYSEFQGDEGTVMIRAAQAILGDDAQLFYHQKGPAEVLLPIATWTLSGTINEWQARLPFAFAGILGVVAIYLLGRRWFHENERSALVAALLLAINGYFVGFGRSVQYQSFVLAMTALALLALWRWSEGKSRRWLTVGAALLASGLLAHYDAVLALPAAAYVVGRRLWTARSQWRVLVIDTFCAGALALGILALFYVPFALHPNFAKTLDYLGGARIGTGGPLYNNLLTSLSLATFYNSIYYLIGLTCLIVIASFLPFRRFGLLIPIVCYLLVLLQPLTSNLQPPIWIGPLLTCLLLAILFSSRSSTPARAAWLWFGVPFLFYYFLVWDPRTHVLNAFPGAVLLAAFALDYLFTLVPNHIASSLQYLSFVVFLFLAYYPYLMFVQHDPEIKRTWPTHQPTLYLKPDDETPLFGYFGFPYRAGWKVIGGLIEEGVLNGVFASNEEPQVADWYTRGAVRTYCPNPDWYLIAQNVQDEVPIHQTEIEATYHLWGKVQVGGKPKLRIYHRDSSAVSPTIYHVEDYAPRFDAQTTPAKAVLPPQADYVPAGHTLGEVVRLLGYHLDTANARPGGFIYLVLYWEALQPIETNYQVFNHLYDETSGMMWGQQDGTPGCALQPTIFWEPGQIVRDEYTIQIDPTTPASDIPLLVGMYTLDTGERLPVRDPDGLPISDTILLTMVTVQ